MDSIDWTGLMFVSLAAAMLAAVLRAVDALLLTRQIKWLNTWAIRCFIFFDDLTVPNLPAIAADTIGKVAKLVLYLGLFSVAYNLILDIDAISIPIFIGFYTCVFYFTVKFLQWASSKGFLLLALVGIVAILSFIIYPTVNPNKEHADEGELIADSFMHILLVLPLSPVFVYLAILFFLYFMMLSFWLFKSTTCHMFELSVERKTIFAHIGVMIGLFSTLVKILIEVKKAFF